MKKLIITIILFFAPFMISAVYAAPVKPFPGGKGNLGNFATRMPSPTARMSPQPYAYPTNKSWGSVYIDSHYHVIYGNAPSQLISLGHTYVKFNSPGYIYSAPNLGIRGGGGDIAGLISEAGYLCLLASTVPNARNYINSPVPIVTKYSDWSFTTERRDAANPLLKMTSTFVKGGVFVYNTFAPNTYATLQLGWLAGGLSYNSQDGAIIVNQKNQWFGVYVPDGTQFTPHNYNWSLGINFPAGAVNEEDRYVVLAYLGSETMYPTVDAVRPVFEEYKKYAYNFVTDTEVSWQRESDSSVSTTFNITLAPPKRTGGDFVSGQTLFALYPHQWRYLASGSAAMSNAVAPQYTTLRGKLKIYQGNSFKTKYEFHGILPSLTYEVPESGMQKFTSYLNTDKAFEINTVANNTYRRGKALAKAANLIPILHQADRIADRNTMINQLKNELIAWYSGTGGQSFGYDSTWGGIVGTPYDFGTDLYNDHHFHYGYFVYASAILAMFDPDFASDAQYKGIVDLLVKDYANSDRSSHSFPFLRNFDIYEGHSWSNGKGSTDAGDDGTDQESISEAMNAWAAVYLWGVATNNQEFIDTAMYGYTTESKASEEYYFDIHNETYPSAFAHRGGILYDSAIKYRVHWEASGTTAQEKYGIWILPMTPSMLYLGYNTAAAQAYYDRMSAEPANNNTAIWRDIFLRYKSLYNAPLALAEWNAWNPSASAENEGSSLSFSYHFINFFNAFGFVSTDYYAVDQAGNSVPFTVMKKSNNVYTFIAYNYSGSAKTVRFLPRSGSSSAPGGGVMSVPAGAIAKTQDFQSFQYDLTDAKVVKSSNTARDVYSIYSDSFLGGVVEGDAYNDKLALDSWSNTITFAPNVSFAQSYEGEKFLSATRTNSTWGGWAFRFDEGNGAVDMSSYYGGKVEFNVRISAGSPIAGSYTAGIQTGSGNALFTLSELGFDQNSTEWQTLSIPLNSEFHPYITEKSLVYASLPFIMEHNAGTLQQQRTVYVDCVLWKKPDISSLFALDLKDRTSGVLVSSITWTDSDFRDANAVSGQFIEIDMINAEGNTWTLQIYTDNKHIITEPGSQAAYEGEISTQTVSGLVNTHYPAREMLPMLWRAAPSTLTEDEVLDFNWMSPWMAFKDISSFDGTDLYKGHEYITIMNRKGFKYDQNASGALFGAPQGDMKIKLFFMADLRKALRSEYFANIIIEYFNE